MRILAKWPAFVMLGLIIAGLWTTWVDHTLMTDSGFYMCANLLILLVLGGFFTVRSLLWRQQLKRPYLGWVLVAAPLVAFFPLWQAMRYDTGFYILVSTYLLATALIVRFEFWPRRFL